MVCFHANLKRMVIFPRTLANWIGVGAVMNNLWGIALVVAVTRGAHAMCLWNCGIRR
jgi:hypothetical protein